MTKKYQIIPLLFSMVLLFLLSHIIAAQTVGLSVGTDIVDLGGRSA